MNRKMATTSLSTFMLTSAGNALAQSSAVNAIDIGGGVGWYKNLNWPKTTNERASSRI